MIDESKLKAAIQHGGNLAECASYLSVTEMQLTDFVWKTHNKTFDVYKDEIFNHTRLALKQKAIELALSGNVKMLELCLEILAKWSRTLNISAPKETILKLSYNLEAPPKDVTPKAEDPIPGQ